MIHGEQRPHCDTMNTEFTNKVQMHRLAGAAGFPDPRDTHGCKGYLELLDMPKGSLKSLSVICVALIHSHGSDSNPSYDIHAGTICCNKATKHSSLKAKMLAVMY